MYAIALPITTATTYHHWLPARVPFRPKWGVASSQPTTLVPSPNRCCSLPLPLLYPFYVG